MKSLIKWSGALILIAILAFVGINLIDEGLDPALGSYGQPRAAAVPDQENGYFALLGMGAPEGSDAMAYGRAWLDEARAAAREGRRAKLPAKAQVKRPELCDPQERSCLVEARAPGARIPEQLEPYREDLDRYDRMIAFRRFEEVLDYPFSLEAELPAYGAVARGQRAYLLRVAADIEAGRLEEAVAALEREVAWQRLSLAESRMLIGKMVTAAGYWRDLMFVSDMLDTRAAELGPFLPRLRTMLGPIEAALPRVAETEFGFARQSFAKLPAPAGDTLDGIGWSLAGLLYQPNATVNHAYRYYAALGKSVFGAPAHRARAEWEAFSREWHDRPWWRGVYNPVGNILLSIAMPGWEDYAMVVHDLDALNRLVALRVEMLASGVTPDQVPAFVAAADRRFYDPYTEKPMRWDAGRKRLYYEAGSRRAKQRRHGVEDGRVFVRL